jgi:predicted MFS family arabinose efflux permease
MSFPAAVVSTDVSTTVNETSTSIESGPPRPWPEGDHRVRLRRRLRPLYLAAMLQGMILWVPVEKLFLDEIGFDAASIGVMAAAYAAVVPFLEIPSGILADRWSRRGVLIVASVALMVSELVGGLSTNVATYIVAAVLLGIFFAMQSGTVDSIIYDTVVEELGDSNGFEATIGRLRMWESAALVTSSLAGAGLATVTSTRLTYFLTIPFGVVSVRALLAFREPRLHEAADSATLRSQIALTYRTILGRGRLLPIIATMVLTSLLLQALLEFGPLWMVALAAPAILYGPHWAGLMSAFGLGGALAGRIKLARPATLGAVVALMMAFSLTLTATRAPIVVIVAQVGLAVLIVAVSTHLTRLLHDCIPSTIRAGVASGIGTLTWIAFLPFALTFGAVSKQAGVHAAGWLMVAVTVATAVALVRLVWVRRANPAPCEPSAPSTTLPFATLAATCA